MAERARTLTAPKPRPKSAERKRNRTLTRRGRLTLTLSAAGAAVLAACAAVLFLTPLLDVRTVAVSLDPAPVHGDHRLTAGQIEAAAAIHPHGQPLARADLGAIESRVAALPRVATVRAARAWPHTIRLTVTERRPVAVLRTAGHRYAEVDASGDRFDTTARPPAGVPEIRMDPTHPRSADFSDAELLRGAVSVAGTLPPAIRSRADWVQVESYDDITVRLSGKGGKSLVRWGSPGRGSLKAAALAALLKRDGSAAVYDVSAPGNPAIG